MKKGKKKKNGFSEYIDTYNNLESKGNIQNTLLKSLVDIAGVTVGTGIGALVGKNSIFVGFAALLTGHFIGDKSNVLRIIGSSTIAYGIGKAKEYNSNPKMNTSQARLSDLNDSWLTALHIKMKKEKSVTNSNDSEVSIEEIIPKQEVKSKIKEKVPKTTLENKAEFSDIHFPESNDYKEQEKQQLNKFQENDNSKENEFDDPDFSLM